MKQLLVVIKSVTRLLCYCLGSFILIFGFALPVLAHGDEFTIPFGFQDEILVRAPFLITDIEFAHDGAIWLLDKNGKVSIFKDGKLDEPILALSVDAEKERGLLGIVFDPDFQNSGYFYLYYTTGSASLNYSGEPKNRVSRFTFNHATRASSKESELILLDNITSDSGMHNGGGIKLGPDGKLYIPTGDGGKYSKNAQDLSNLGGKILRINRDGTIPEDNPFVGRKSARGEIWAYGLRNPWRISFDSETGALYAADVGGGAAEEVNYIEPGKNYGWPQTEGLQPAKVRGVTYPAYSYKHSKKGASIIGGEVYRGTNFGEHYDGRYFFADFVTYELRSAEIYNERPKVEVFGTDMGGMVDVSFGPDGALYLAVADSPFTGHVEKISYTGKFNPNTSRIKAAASVTYGKLPLAVNFKVVGKPDTKVLKYEWNFGDGTSGIGENAQHIYRKKGKYEAVLRVLHDGQVVARDTVTIYAGNLPPKISITPLLKGKYKAGDKIEFVAQAVDIEDGKLAPEKLSWQVILGHNEHEHPFLDGANGSRLIINAPRDGETDANVRLRVIVRVADSLGLMAEKSISVYPQKIQVRLLSNIAGVSFMLDGKTVKAPYLFLGVANFPRELSAPETVTTGGRVYKFKKWSNGGAREQKFSSNKSTVLQVMYERKK